MFRPVVAASYEMQFVVNGGVLIELHPLNTPKSVVVMGNDSVLSCSNVIPFSH